MLPLVARSTMEVLALVPNHLREASYALGVSKWQTVMRVVLPTCFGGILTGTTLAIARAAGETAPLLFTCAIAGQIVDWNPTHSVQSMPLTIFAVLRVGRPEPAPAGLGDGVRPDRLRARHEPDRAPSARAHRGASSGSRASARVHHSVTRDVTRRQPTSRSTRAGWRPSTSHRNPQGLRRQRS